MVKNEMVLRKDSEKYYNNILQKTVVLNKLKRTQKNNMTAVEVIEMFQGQSVKN